MELGAITLAGADVDCLHCGRKFYCVVLPVMELDHPKALGTIQFYVLFVSAPRAPLLTPVRRALRTADLCQRDVHSELVYPWLVNSPCGQEQLLEAHPLTIHDAAFDHGLSYQLTKEVILDRI